MAQMLSQQLSVKWFLCQANLESCLSSSSSFFFSFFWFVFTQLATCCSWICSPPSPPPPPGLLDWFMRIWTVKFTQLNSQQSIWSNKYKTNWLFVCLPACLSASLMFHFASSWWPKRSAKVNEDDKKSTDFKLYLNFWWPNNTWLAAQSGAKFTTTTANFASVWSVWSSNSSASFGSSALSVVDVSVGVGVVVGSHQTIRRP